MAEDSVKNWSACSVCGVVVAREHQDRHTDWHEDFVKVMNWVFPENKGETNG
jgi:hypothetical protein